MEILRNLRKLEPGPTPPIAAIGNFDGVHLGHQRLLGRLVDAARERSGPSLVITFEPHPVKILAPDQELALIMPYTDKLALFERLGVDQTLVIRFTRTFAAMDSERFIRDVLHRQLRLCHVLVGPDTRFGRDRGGGFAQIARLGAALGFTAETIPPVVIDGITVSSTAVRERIAGGKVEDAARLLGRYHRVAGQVVRGARRGRRLGFPTANLHTANELLPGDGVYAGVAHWRGGRYEAVVNIGLKPTFGGKQRTVEAHLLDFDGALYGERVRLDFVARIRAEQRFRSVDELSCQIRADIVRGRSLLRGRR